MSTYLRFSVVAIACDAMFWVIHAAASIWHWGSPEAIYFAPALYYEPLTFLAPFIVQSIGVHPDLTPRTDASLFVSLGFVMHVAFGLIMGLLARRAHPTR